MGHSIAMAPAHGFLSDLSLAPYSFTNMPFELPPYYADGRRAALEYARAEGWEDSCLDECKVGWEEQDVNGHVNNLHFFKWIDVGRNKLLTSFASPPPDHGTGSGIGMIIARQTCDYIGSVTFPDHVMVASRLKNGGIGEKKHVLEHMMWSYKQQAPVAYGESVVVMFDYTAQKPVAIPETMQSEARAREWKGKPLGRVAKSKL